MGGNKHIGDFEFVNKLNQSNIKNKIFNTKAELDAATLEEGDIAYCSEELRFYERTATETRPINGTSSELSYLSMRKDNEQNNVAAGNSISFLSVRTSIGNNITRPDNNTFILQPGTYQLISDLEVSGFTGNSDIRNQWYNVTDATYVGTNGITRPLNWSSNHSDKPQAYAIVTVTVPTTFELRASSVGSSTIDVRGGSAMRILQLPNSVEVPATSIEAIQSELSISHCVLSSDQTTNFNNGNKVRFDSERFSKGNNIIFNGTSSNFNWLLKAGKSYKLTADVLFRHNASASAAFRWELEDGTLIPGSEIEKFTNTHPGHLSGNSSATAYISPVVDTTVKFVKSSGTINQYDALNTWATVEEIPSHNLLAPKEVSAKPIARAQYNKTSAINALDGTSKLFSSGEIFNNLVHQENNDRFTLDNANSRILVTAGSRVRISYSLCLSNTGYAEYGFSLSNSTVDTNVNNGFVQRGVALTSSFSSGTSDQQLAFVEFEPIVDTHIYFWQHWQSGGPNLNNVYSWLKCEEMPTHNAVIPETMEFVDQGVSGYVDIGSVRIQWGQRPGSGVVTLPAPFANTDYSITTATLSGAVNTLFSNTVHSLSTTEFSLLGSYLPHSGASGGPAVEFIKWQAIGLKP